MEVVRIDQISPDLVILLQWGFVTINATLVYTWLIMGMLVTGSIVVTRSLSTDVAVSRWQNLVEVIVSGIRSEIRDIAHEDVDKYFPLIGTFFLFILLSNLLTNRLEVLTFADVQPSPDASSPPNGWPWAGSNGGPPPSSKSILISRPSPTRSSPRPSRRPSSPPASRRPTTSSGGCGRRSSPSS